MRPRLLPRLSPRPEHRDRHLLHPHPRTRPIRPSEPSAGRHSFGSCSDDDGDDDVRELDRTFRADAGRRSGHPDHAGDHHDVDRHDVDRDEAGLRSHDRLRGRCERGQARGPRPGDHDSAGHTGGNRSPSSSGGCGAGSDAAFRFAPRPRRSCSWLGLLRPHRPRPRPPAAAPTSSAGENDDAVEQVAAVSLRPRSAVALGFDDAPALKPVTRAAAAAAPVVVSLKSRTAVRQACIQPHGLVPLSQRCRLVVRAPAAARGVLTYATPPSPEVRAAIDRGAAQARSGPGEGSASPGIEGCTGAPDPEDPADPPVRRRRSGRVAGRLRRRGRLRFLVADLRARCYAAARAAAVPACSSPSADSDHTRRDRRSSTRPTRIALERLRS